MSKVKEAKPSSLHLPPGFRFHPTDEELVVHYLAKKAESKPFPIAVIAEVDLYKFNPWDLPEKAYFGEREWYFFTPRDRKYPKGARPNRAASSGYWKATGTDKSIFTGGHKRVGVKKALVFYDGKAPKGVKSNWIMHEYRLAETSSNKSAPGTKNKCTSRFDDRVLCRIYEKTSSAFKVMVPVHHLEPEPEPESEPEDELVQEPEAEPEEEEEEEHEQEAAETRLDEMLASLPDLDVSQHDSRDPSMCESMEDLLNSTNDVPSTVVQYPGDYVEDSFQVNIKSFPTQGDNKVDVGNYWSLYNSHGNFFASPMLVETTSNVSDFLQLMQGGRKRTKLDD